MNKPLVLVTGASGFIGSYLVPFLLKQDYRVVGLTRQKNKISNHPCLEWVQDLKDLKTDQIDYVINLAGESIGEGRWTDQRKEKLIQSRLVTTENLYKYLARRSIHPKVIISGSAVGYYGIDLTETWAESCIESSDAQPIFMSQLCQRWEDVTKSYPDQNTKTIRLGVVFGKKGGILPQMLFPIKMNLVGKIGHGRQPCAWVHIKDVLKAIEFLMLKETEQSVFNLVAPERTSQSDFVKNAEIILKRKPFFKVPAGIFKLLLGEKSQLILNGQYVKPKALQELGYEFEFPTLKEALNNLIDR
jgi:uncharacterized protein